MGRGTNVIIGKDGYIGSTLDIEVYPGTTILLAGHSSVAACNNDPDGAWVNNVDYFRSVLRNSRKLIYASSASVYDHVKNPDETTNEFNLKSMYDLTKRTIDNLALLSGQEVYGLRFATVNGWSPNLRVDVMLNKMVYDAKTTGTVTVTNPQLVRPILGINDLGRAIQAIVDGPDRRGIYNLASFNSSVLHMANEVARRYSAKVIINGSDPGTYVYGVNTTKFEEAYNFKFEDSLESVLDSLDKPFEKVGIRV